LPGAGEGHWFTFTARMPSSKATQLRIVPAKVKDATRPKRLAVINAQGAWHVDVPDSAKDAPGTGYVADLPTPLEGCITGVIESTYAPNGTTAFAELEVFGEAERSGGGDAIFARVVAAGGEGAKSAAQTLARRGAGAVAAIDTELAKATDSAARGRLVRAL